MRRTLLTLLSLSESIRVAPIHSNQILNLDVVSLFTMLHTHEALSVVRDKLKSDSSLEQCTKIPMMT